MRQLWVYTLVIAGGCATHSNSGSTTGGSTGGTTESTLETCANYCTEATAHCLDANVPSDIDTSSTCQQTCGRFPVVNDPNAVSGDSLECRIYHLGAPAMGNPNLHCPHGGVSGANTCGAWCDVYCREALTNCTGSNAIYSTSTACQAACQGLAATGSPGDTGGNTVQCRIYHLNVAGESAPLATEHCPHGMVNSAPCS